MSTPELTRIFVRDLSYFSDRAGGLVAVVHDGLPEALHQVRAWHPTLRDADAAAIRTRFSTEDAKLVYARQHGFENWSAFTQYVQHIPPDATGEPFLAAFEAGRAGEWQRVATILAAHPDVARARGTNGNTMLNLASSLSERPTPSELATGVGATGRLDGVRLLLQSGADVNAANDRGSSPLHQAAYRNDPAMVQLFLDAGAVTDRSAHGVGGTPLAFAAFWGHRESVDVLSKGDIVPNNLRMAASVGRADLVAACFTDSGELTAAAKDNRAFYRPHSGFPSWTPSDSADEILDEALVWAAKSDRTEILDTLVQHGAHLDGNPYRGTALAWAAAKGRVATIQWLIANGAYVNLLTTFGGFTHGRDVTALHLAAQSNQPEAVRALLDLGADASIKDALYGATPRGWAEHEGAAAVLALL